MSFYDGRYWNLYVLAFHRDKWDELKKRLLPAVTGKRPRLVPATDTDASLVGD